jgi:hypothetical protein
MYNTVFETICIYFTPDFNRPDPLAYAKILVFNQYNEWAKTREGHDALYDDEDDDEYRRIFWVQAQDTLLKFQGTATARSKSWNS